MNLLYLANARIPTPRAYGLQIMKTCEAFTNSGINVDLVVPTRRVHSTEDPFEYYHLTRRFPITTLSVPDFLRYGPLGFLVSALWFSEKVRRLSSFRKADVIYSRDALILFQYLLLGRILVFEAHGRPSFISRIVARRAYRVIVISKGLKSVYQTAGVTPEKLVVAPDAVDLDLFDNVPARQGAREEVGLPVGKRVVLYAGHLYPRKGADTLAATAELVPTAHFVFVGGASDDLAVFRKRWGSGANIEIIGHVPHAQIPLYLRAADVLALPNSGKDEDSARFTSPMKLFEYMASGTPIVASDVPAIREVLSDESAYFIPPDDPAALAASIEKALDDTPAASRIAVRAHQLVQSYSWKGRAGKILAAFARDTSS